jgi:hypothetical protein
VGQLSIDNFFDAVLVFGNNPWYYFNCRGKGGRFFAETAFDMWIIEQSLTFFATQGASCIDANLDGIGAQQTSMLFPGSFAKGTTAGMTFEFYCYRHDSTSEL